MIRRPSALRLLHLFLAAVLSASICEAQCGAEMAVYATTPPNELAGHHHHSQALEHPNHHPPDSEKHACNLDHVALEGVTGAPPPHSLSGNLFTCASQGFPSPVPFAIGTLFTAPDPPLERRFLNAPTTLRI